MYEDTVKFIQKLYNTKEFIPLHKPRFIGNEKSYLNDAIDSTFVSSVGAYVDKFEKKFATYVGSRYAIATVNGTSALHIALILADVNRGDEVITQPLTFVATANAISYIGAKPVFVDVDIDTLGMSAKALNRFLELNCELVDNKCMNKVTHRQVKACVPMHTFGNPCRIDEIKTICKHWHITLVEDSAESLGSFLKDRHTGTFGKLGVFSFNGNKIITSGGGGVIVTDDEALAKVAKHLTTTAKVPHKFEYVHDDIGYNYRMPNLNAALLVAQLEKLNEFLEDKKELTFIYSEYFEKHNIKFVKSIKSSKSNCWLNAVIFRNIDERNNFLEYTNSNGIMTRPIWKMMNKLEMFKDAQCGDLSNSVWLEERVVNLPSSVRK